jgi:hypothetical protein
VPSCPEPTYQTIKDVEFKDELGISEVVQPTKHILQIQRIDRRMRLTNIDISYMHMIISKKKNTLASSKNLYNNACN